MKNVWGIAAVIAAVTVGIWIGMMGVAHAAYPRSADSTAYSETGLMANGQHTHYPAVAMNIWPLGTKITLKHKGPHGRRRFIVEDRIGWGSQLDFWVSSCSYANDVWGRRQVAYRLGWSK